MNSVESKPNPASDMSCSHPVRAAGEVSLGDVWLLFVRRRNLIVTVFVLSVLTTGAIVLLTAPVFESRAVIQVGVISDVGPLESTADLVQRLKGVYQVGGKSNCEGEMPCIKAVTFSNSLASRGVVINARELSYIKEVSFDRTLMDHSVTIVAQDSSAEGARRFLEDVTNKLLEEHRLVFNDVVRRKREQLSRLDQRIIDTRRHVEILAGQLAKVSDKEPAVGALIALEQTKLLEQMSVMDKQRADLEIGLSGIKTWESRVVREPTLARAPQKPRPVLYGALGSAVGLMLGILAAIVAEFAANARRQTL